MKAWAAHGSWDPVKTVSLTWGTVVKGGGPRRTSPHTSHLSVFGNFHSRAELISNVFRSENVCAFEVSPCWGSSVTVQLFLLRETARAVSTAIQARVKVRSCAEVKCHQRRQRSRGRLVQTSVHSPQCFKYESYMEPKTPGKFWCLKNTHTQTHTYEALLFIKIVKTF